VKNRKIKRMVGIALLMAMVIVLQFVGGMIPPIGGTVSISLVLIPIVLGSAVYGPGAGALLGATFAVVTIINCITGTDAGGAMVFQASPVLCILVVAAKSILAGLAAGYVYKLLEKRNGYIAMLCAAIICPVVNTGVFVGCMALFFSDVLSAWASGSDVLSYVLMSLILCNFVPEMLINVVFSPAGNNIVRVINKTK
jgi:uncharacterized membrane protein